jgi:hypothetical protein
MRSPANPEEERTKPVRAEPVEALTFFLHRKGKERPFDKLRANGVGILTRLAQPPDPA